MDNGTRLANDVIRWIDEIIDIKVNNRKIEDSWIARGGFRITPLGCKAVEANVKKKLDKSDLELGHLLKKVNEVHKNMSWRDWGGWDYTLTPMTLIYIGFENLCQRQPTLADISSTLFNDDLRKTLIMLTNLTTFSLVEFVHV